MRLDQKVERPQGGGTRADLVGERGQAELDAFVRIAIALTVQRLVLAELLEQDHRKQARAEHAARGRVERRGRLTSRFAGAAGEPPAHGLDDLPPARAPPERPRYLPPHLPNDHRPTPLACPRRPPLSKRREE